VELGNAKLDFFRRGPQHLQEDIIPLMHPYFARLADLLCEWWEVLYEAHHTCDEVMQGFIHDEVLRVLVKYQVKIRDGDPTAAEKDAESFREAEQKRRFSRHSRELTRFSASHAGDRHISWQSLDYTIFFMLIRVRYKTRICSSYNRKQCPKHTHLIYTALTAN